MRITVVGGGVIGLLTAIECVRAGGEHQVDLVDAGPIPSPAATSNDRLRVVRALHRGVPTLTLAAAGAHAGWMDVECLIGTRFYHPTGALTAMPEQDTPAELALLTTAGAKAWALSPKDLATWYPRIRFPAGTAAVLEATAGVVLADHALVAMAHWLGAQSRVRLHPHRQAVAVSQSGEAAMIRFADGETRTTDRVVVAAGPWSRELLPTAVGSDLTLYRQSVLSYRPPTSRRDWAGMPAVLGLGPARDAWLMPSVPQSDAPMRLSAASACRPVDEMSDRVTPDKWREHLIGVFSRLLPAFDPAAVVGASDGFYLAERTHGGPLLTEYGAGRVLAFAACGGMSFKFAPQIARAIADRAVGATPRPTGLDSIDRPRQLAAVGEE
ncbi:NAD(P)/FAD-dependent oxidoreductase [Kribbella catacumbae]|uniref:NAD(P)/FAD-dependent oxidoreductase n=1 Tax=Kribbella catacumbae TaxID=460086 RepID=UPI0003738D8F|nr:FAD-binding oxidoreductase [Kribbella catacumbae]